MGAFELYDRNTERPLSSLEFGLDGILDAREQAGSIPSTASTV
jgi:hypothetical protein